VEDSVVGLLETEDAQEVFRTHANLLQADARGQLWPPGQRLVSRCTVLATVCTATYSAEAEIVLLPCLLQILLVA
jgi:hypothetical protein